MNTMVNHLRRIVLVALICSPPLFSGSDARAGEAASPTAEDIVGALTPRKRRGADDGADAFALSSAAAQSELAKFREIRRRRGPTVQEREALFNSLKPLPQIDLTVYFAFDSADIGTEAAADLAELGAALSSAKLRRDTFVLAGHTDANGSAGYNLELSERRANAVRDYLVRNFGLSAANFDAVGYGLEQLADPEKPLSGENRRVQIFNAGP